MDIVLPGEVVHIVRDGAGFSFTGTEIANSTLALLKRDAAPHDVPSLQAYAGVHGRYGQQFRPHQQYRIRILLLIIALVIVQLGYVAVVVRAKNTAVSRFFLSLPVAAWAALGVWLNAVYFST